MRLVVPLSPGIRVFACVCACTCMCVLHVCMHMRTYPLIHITMCLWSSTPTPLIHPPPPSAVTSVTDSPLPNARTASVPRHASKVSVLTPYRAPHVHPPLPHVWCRGSVVCCMLSAACCLLHVVCSMLYVACCLLHLDAVPCAPRATAAPHKSAGHHCRAHHPEPARSSAAPPAQDRAPRCRARRTA